MDVKQLRRSYKYPRTFITPRLCMGIESIEVKRFVRDTDFDAYTVGMYRYNIHGQFLEIYIDDNVPVNTDGSENGKGITDEGKHRGRNTINTNGIFDGGLKDIIKETRGV